MSLDMSQLQPKQQAALRLLILARNSPVPADELATIVADYQTMISRARSLFEGQRERHSPGGLGGGRGGQRTNPDMSVIETRQLATDTGRATNYVLKIEDSDTVDLDDFSSTVLDASQMREERQPGAVALLLEPYVSIVAGFDLHRSYADSVTWNEVARERALSDLVSFRSYLAEALHHLGRHDEALRQFDELEHLNVETDVWTPRLLELYTRSALASTTHSVEEARRVWGLRAEMGGGAGSDTETAEALNELDSATDGVAVREKWRERWTTQSSQRPLRIGEAPGSRYVLPSRARPKEPQRDDRWSSIRDQIVADSMRLDLGGFHNPFFDDVGLEQIFIPLYAKPAPAQVDSKGGRYSDASLLSLVVDASMPCLLVGASGCGKSTFMRWKCLQVARAGGVPVPIYLDLSMIELQKFRTSMGFDEARLLEQAASQLRARGIALSTSELSELRSSGGLLWYVDHLNAVTDAALASAILAFFSSSLAGGPAVVATTPAHFGGLRNVPHASRVDVDEMRPDDVAALLRAYFRLRLGDESDEIERRVAPVVREVLQSRDLLSLCSSPLYSTAVALVTSGRETDPMAQLLNNPSRARVLDAALSYVTGAHSNAVSSSLSGPDCHIHAYGALALRIKENGDSPITRKEALQALEVLECPTGISGRRCVSSPDEFLVRALASEVVARPHGRRVAVDEEFRDYLVADLLASTAQSRDHSSLWTHLSPHLDDPAWSRIVEFIALRLALDSADSVSYFVDEFAATSLGIPYSDRLARVAALSSVLQDLNGERTEALAGSPRWLTLVDSVDRLLVDPVPIGPLQVRVRTAVSIGLTRAEDPADAGRDLVWFPSRTYRVGRERLAADEPVFGPLGTMWDLPDEEVHLDAFAIGRHPITVAQFERFVENDGYHEEALWSEAGWSWRQESGIALPLDWRAQRRVFNAPVTGVSWHEAAAFCKYVEASTSDDLSFWLPTERHWEAVATQPYGDRPGPPDLALTGDMANVNNTHAGLRYKTPVGLFPASNVRGVTDMLGNVEEWCRDEWDGGIDRIVADRLGVTKDPGHTTTARVVRGGSCIRTSRLCRPTYRSKTLETGRFHTLGFRMMAIQERS